MGAREIDAGSVFRFISVQNDIPLVVTGLADQPAEDVLRLCGIGDPRVVILAVKGEDVVLGNGPPMYVPVALAGPALDASEQPLDAGPVATNRVRDTINSTLFIVNDVLAVLHDPIAGRVFFEFRHQVFRAREDEDVGVDRIEILWQALFGLTCDGG